MHSRMPPLSLWYTKESSRSNLLYVLLTAAFAAFFLVFFGHPLSFPLQQSHESSFSFVSIVPPSMKRLRCSSDARICSYENTHYENDSTMDRVLSCHLRSQKIRYTRPDQDSRPAYGMIARML